MKVPDFQLQQQVKDLPVVRQMINSADYHFVGANQSALASVGAQTAEQLNQMVSEFTAQQQHIANSTRVQDAQNQTQQAINQLLYGSEGVLSKQGAEVFQAQANGLGLTANTLSSLTRHIAGVTDDLANSEQRQQYQHWAGQAQQQVASLLAQHEGQQFRVYQRGVAQATIAGQQQTMALNYNNPKLLQAGATAIHQASVDLAQLEGYPDDYGVVQGQKQVGQAITAAVHQALLNQDSQQAASVVQHFAEAMDSDSRLNSQLLVNKAIANQQALAISAKLLAGSAKQMPGLAQLQAEAISQLPEQANLELRQQVLQTVASQYHAQRQGLALQRAEAKAKALSALENNGGQYSALSSELQAAVWPQDVASVSGFADKLAHGQAITTDSSLFYQLLTNPNKLPAINLMAVRDRLSQSDYQLLHAQQQQLAGGQPGVYQQGKDLLSQLLTEAGVNAHPKDQHGQAVVGRVWSAFAHRLAVAQQPGQTLSEEAVAKIAGQMFTRVAVASDLLANSYKPAVLVDSLHDKVVVPEADRAEIIKGLQAKQSKEAISNEQVFYQYLRNKGLVK